MRETWNFLEFSSESCPGNWGGRWAARPDPLSGSGYCVCVRVLVFSGFWEVVRWEEGLLLLDCAGSLSFSYYFQI
ncbi:hypothetical protein VTJ04DRAFT_9234 [Mycothermus thermophilus]|uniref:uncharacterized protein n=1 Tax=Humicola insolens TaxID=85995 RepID=UPI00374343CF